jgi:hypothetical protein
LAYGEDEKTSKELLGKNCQLADAHLKKINPQLLRSFSECFGESGNLVPAARFPL